MSSRHLLGCARIAWPPASLRTRCGFFGIRRGRRFIRSSVPSCFVQRTRVVSTPSTLPFRKDENMTGSECPCRRRLSTRVRGTVKRCFQIDRRAKSVVRSYENRRSALRTFDDDDVRSYYCVAPTVFKTLSLFSGHDVRRAGKTFCAGGTYARAHAASPAATLDPQKRRAAITPFNRITDNV